MKAKGCFPIARGAIEIARVQSAIAKGASDSDGHPPIAMRDFSDSEGGFSDSEGASPKAKVTSPIPKGASPLGKRLAPVQEDFSSLSKRPRSLSSFARLFCCL